MSQPHFQLISRVATTRFSTVDHARMPQSGVCIALKRPRAGSGQASLQLQQEARILARIHHPNVVRLYEAGTDAQGPYLALEWLEGQTMEEQIERQPFDAARLRQVMIAALEALAAIHQEGFVHGDVNATNVLLPVNGGVKMIDLGNARPLGACEPVEKDQANIGSVHSMAPELFSGQPPSVRSDLYALGVLAWHGLTQRYPFDGDTPAQVITAHLRLVAPPLPVSTLAAWVQSLLARDPAARPASAAEALDSMP